MDQSNLHESDSRRNPTVAVTAVVVLVIVCTMLVFRSLRQAEQARVQAVFERRTVDIQDAMVQRIQVYSASVQSLASLYDATGKIEHEQFNAFVARCLREHDGIQALGWNPRVPSSERQMLESRMRSEGFDDFQIRRWTPTRNPQWTAPNFEWADEYVPVTYIQPLKGNEAAIGIDVASHPARYEALRNARDTGKPVASSPVRLAQEVDDQRGVLLFVPVYARGEIVDSLENRRDYVVGYAVGVFRIGDIVESTLQERDMVGVHLQIHDVTDPDQDPLEFYDSHQSVNNGALTRRNVIDIVGRKWAFQFTAADSFDPSFARTYSWLVLIGGCLLAFLVGTVLQMLLGRTSQVEHLARQRTKELRETLAVQQRVFESTPIGLVIYDDQGTIKYANSAFCTIFGYETEELLGKSTERLIPEDSDSQRGTGSGDRSHELVGLHKDGNLIEIEIARTQIPLPEGASTLASLTDVTEKRRHEIELRNTNAHLARFNKAAIGREKRMIELKREINELLRAAGQPSKYQLQ